MPSDGRPAVGMTTSKLTPATAATRCPSARPRARRASRDGARRRARARAGRPGAEPKHSSASRGSSTIGRPAVFRLVLTTTGTPVRALEALEHAGHERLVVAVDGLDARGAVDVDDGGDPVAPRAGAPRA